MNKREFFYTTVVVILMVASFNSCKEKEDEPEPTIPVITITTHPAATTGVIAGSISGSLTVVASVTGSATLSYQWYSNNSNSKEGGTEMNGATSASFVIPATLTANTYYYFCEVRASGGATSVRSNVATVTVTAAAATPFITITTQPVATTSVTAGSISESLTVAASVTESATLSYQWYSNDINSKEGGTEMNGATSASFVIPATLTANTYYYFCEVRASGGATSVRSNVATVTVTAPAVTPVITITTHPTATTSVNAGSISGSLTVAASVTESATLSYQWYSNNTNSKEGGTEMNGETSASFDIPATLTVDTYYYFCEVRASGGATAVRSNVATVTVSAALPFCGGAGTSSAPYLICSVQQLINLATLVNTNSSNSVYGNKYYKLTDDINLTDIAWTPIGTQAWLFSGHFDGNGKTVRGLNVNGGGNDKGLFGVMSGGTVVNLGVVGTVSGGDNVGGIAGMIMSGSKITNCYTAVTVSGNQSVGGVVGFISSHIINGVSSVSNCYATGAVSGNQSVGGVAGHVSGASSTYRSSVTNCYATGIVSGYQSVGGVAGIISNGNVTNCAALNPSINRSSGSLTSFGRVTSSNASASITISNNMAYDVMTLPDGTLFGNNGENITAADAQLQTSYTTHNWKFGTNDENPWKMGVGNYKLPVFYWQTEAPGEMPF